MAARGDFAVNRRLILVSSIAVVIGAVCSLIAVLLLSMINLFTNLFYYQDFSIAHRIPADHTLGIWAVGIPAFGGLLIGLIARYGTEKIRGHGIPEALEAILFGRSIMEPKVAILKPVSSAIAIGSGGPFGAEGPIIMTGGAFGSIISQIFNLSAVERKTLLVAGASAGMTATFGSPIAAVLLAVELLLFEWKPRSLIPVAMACAMAAGIRPFVLEPGPLFSIPLHAPPDVTVLLLSAALGIVAGAFSWFLSFSLYRVEDTFAKLPIHWMWWPAMGGLVVGIGGLIEPRTLGVGYGVISDLLNGNIVTISISLLLLVKGFIWLVSLGSGTSGGVLAPLLMMGCAIGGLVATVFPGEPTLWPLVTMAAVLGGMMRAPFTAVVFALELTHDVKALPAILIASVMAYAFTVLFMKRSILTEKIARRGFDIFREYAVDPLQQMRVEDVMTRNPITIPHSMLASEAVSKFYSGRQKHRGYPVIDMEGRILGIFTATDLLNYAETNPQTDPTVGEIVKTNPVVCYTKEPCTLIAERMARTGVGRLPVLDTADSDRLLGIITRSDLLKVRYKNYEEEEKFERILRRRRRKPKLKKPL